jgi:thiol-disulfide isomerase/thioredoxin
MNHHNYWIAFVLVFFCGCSADDVPVIVATNSIRAQTQVNLPHDLTLRCLDGTEIEPFADPNETKAVVLVFISTDCPIANAYLPYLQRLEAEYRSRGIEMFLVHSSSDVDEISAKAHAEEFGISLPIVLDANQVIARRVGAKVTPEAIVIPHDSGKPAYRGAIDNLYAEYGKKRRAATEHYLANALNDLLARKTVSVPQTKPVGCFISFDD